MQSLKPELGAMWLNGLLFEGSLWGSQEGTRLASCSPMRPLVGQKPENPGRSFVATTVGWDGAWAHHGHHEQSLAFGINWPLTGVHIWQGAQAFRRCPCIHPLGRPRAGHREQHGTLKPESGCVALIHSPTFHVYYPTSWTPLS
jgi:hypothetical protein